eukprot:gene9063-12225_t
MKALKYWTIILWVSCFQLTINFSNIVAIPLNESPSPDYFPDHIISLKNWTYNYSSLSLTPVEVYEYFKIPNATAKQVSLSKGLMAFHEHHLRLLPNSYESNMIFNLSFSVNIQSYLSVNNWIQTESCDNICSQSITIIAVMEKVILHAVKIFVDDSPLNQSDNMVINTSYIFEWKPTLTLNDKIVLNISFYTNATLFSTDESDCALGTNCYEKYFKYNITNLSIKYIVQPEKFEFTDPRLYNNIFSQQASPDGNLIISNNLVGSCNLLGYADALVLNKININSINNHQKQIKLFCGIFTTVVNHDLVKMMRDTWGYKCDGFLAFSTINDPFLPSISLPHIGGDDMFYIIENLRNYLQSDFIQEIIQHNEGLYLGRRLNHYLLNVSFHSGGSGYILDKIALTALSNNFQYCYPDLVDPREDLLVALCLYLAFPISVLATDTRDELLRQRFHTFPVGIEYLFQPSPLEKGSERDYYSMYDGNILSGDDCCSSDSIAFHYLSLDYMKNLYNYLYNCPLEVKHEYYTEKGMNYYDRVYVPKKLKKQLKFD